MTLPAALPLPAASSSASAHFCSGSSSDPSSPRPTPPTTRSCAAQPIPRPSGKSGSTFSQSVFNPQSRVPFPANRAGSLVNLAASRFTCSVSSQAMASADATSAAANPLLSQDLFSPFGEIKPSDVVPGMKKVLEEVEAELAELETSAVATWPGLMEPLERLSDKFSRPWGLVQHLKSVRDCEELRKAVEDVEPQVVALSLKFGQSKPLYNLFQEIREGELWNQLTVAQQRAVEAELESAKASGVGLEGAEKERFNEIEKELAELARKFGNNVLDATKAFSKLITDPKELDGLPPTALRLAAQQAKAKGHEQATAEEGPWLLTLDYPCYQPIQQHCKNRALREEIYRAYITRASGGDLDNSGIIAKILELKKEQAKLLGFENHAEKVMVRRMADLKSAEKLIDDLRNAAWDASVREMDELKAFAREQGAAEADDLKHWDVGFWAERMREAKYELTEEELRPYFQLPAVLDGLFSLASKLFDISIEPADGQAPVWHKDTQFFQVKNTSGQPIAFFYLDPYSRPEDKQGGAWMNPLVQRSKLLAAPGTDVRPPVAVLVCNQMPPVGDRPSLMTFREVETVFHEFGHALQHMLTTQEESSVSGINNIEWDAVELPSQFMENWCYQKDTLLGIAKHFETGETLPDDLFQKILAARTYRAASMAMRQLHWASVDLELHSTFDPSGPDTAFDVYAPAGERMLALPPPPGQDRFLCAFLHLFEWGLDSGYYGYKLHFASIDLELHSSFDPKGVEDPFAANLRVASRMLVMRPLPEDRFLCAFSHIFGGGYSAGYYSYKWAEVLSADAFSAFEDAGLDNETAVTATGRRFRDTVLALGGGKAAKDVFHEFRGREPSIEPLLRHNGLLATKA